MITSLTDADLLSGCAYREAHCLRELSSRVGDRVVSILYLLLGNQSDAETVSMDVLMQIWKDSAQSYHNSDRPVCILQLAVDAARRWRKRHWLRLALSRPSAANRSESDFLQVLDALCYDERVTVVLYYAAGLSVETIGMVMRKPVYLVSKHLAIARRRLHQKLKI